MSATDPNRPNDAHERAWRSFRQQADAVWAEELAEEERIRREVLPSKAIPFPSPVRYPEIVIDRNVRMRMRDGVVLRADIYRPDAGGRFPVAVTRGPYDKTSSLDDIPAVGRNLARRGYVCVAQDVRGRYASDGSYEPFLTEMEDGVDTVEWAAAQPWSTGKVGMFGISYAGFVQFCAAAGRAPHLSCIYPGMIGYGLHTRKTGIPWLASLGAWLIWAGQGRESLNGNRVDTWHLPLHEIDDKSGYPTPAFDALVNMDLDFRLPGEMAEETAREHLRNIEVATCCVAGWYDELIEDTLDCWVKLRETLPDARLIIGPWHHNLCDLEEPRIGSIATEDIELKRYYEEMERFFAWHLKGEEVASPDSGAPVRLYVMGRNRWRNEHEWPLARTQYRTLFLHSSGSAGTSLEDGELHWQAPVDEQPPDKYDYDPQDPVRWTHDVDIWSYLLEMGDRRDVELRSDVLVYTSPVLDEDTEITGCIKAVLFASSDCEDTDFVVNLVDVHPDGHTQYLTHGIVRARYRHGLANPKLLQPGRVCAYEIGLRPTSNVFLTGHRIRIEITSSDFDRYARNQNIAAPEGTGATCVAHQAVFHSGDSLSHLVVPVIPSP